MRLTALPRFALPTVRTNFDSLVVTNIGKSTQGFLCVVTAETSNFRGNILGLADRLQICRIGVLIDGAEKAARGRSDSELSKCEESSGEDGLGEHGVGLCNFIEGAQTGDFIVDRRIRMD